MQICPWMSLDWLRGAVAHAAPALKRYAESEPDHIVRRWYPPDAHADILRLWAEREKFLDALDHLPQTLCHFDAFRGNLFTRQTATGGPELVAIDWAFVGLGAVGQEARALLTHGWRALGKDRARPLMEIVLMGYLEGLSDMGYGADPLHVRLACNVNGAMNRLIGFGQAVQAVHDERICTWAEQAFGLPMEEQADRMAALRRECPYDWAGEARALLTLA
jgi:hypothetical protein